jgi:hypothetical protein
VQVVSKPEELGGTQGNLGELRGTRGNSEELGGTRGNSGELGGTLAILFQTRMGRQLQSLAVSLRMGVRRLFLFLVI